MSDLSKILLWGAAGYVALKVLEEPRRERNFIDRLDARRERNFVDTLDAHAKDEDWNDVHLIGDTGSSITPAGIGIGLAVIGGVGLIAQGYFSGDGSNTARQIEKIPFGTITLAGAVVWGGDKLYKKLNPDSSLQDTTKSTTQAQIDSSTAAGVQPTYNDSDYQDKADSIYEQVRHSYPFGRGAGTAYDNVRDILLTMKNDLDIAKLNKAFGFRERDFFGVLPDGSDKSLPQFVNLLLGPDRINAVNTAYTGQGMTYQF